MNMKKMKILMMILLILFSVCLQLHASSDHSDVINAIDIKKEHVVNKGVVVHLFGRRGRRGRGHRSRGGRRGGSKGIGRIPAVVIPVIVFGGGHQAHDDPNNNYGSNITGSTSNSTSESTACISNSTGDSIACTASNSTSDYIACISNSTSDSIACTSNSTYLSGLSQSISSILALVILVAYYLQTY